MKSALMLFLSIFSICSFAQEFEYMTNPDGSSQYIGNCALHMDYEGKGISKGRVLVEKFFSDFYNDEQALAFYKSLSPVTKNLLELTSMHDGYSTGTGYKLLRYFDDFHAFELNLGMKKTCVVE